MREKKRKAPAPLRSANGTTITDKTRQMERLVEHYSESRGSTISAVTLDAVESKPSMTELDEIPPFE